MKGIKKIKPKKVLKKTTTKGLISLVKNRTTIASIDIIIAQRIARNIARNFFLNRKKLIIFFKHNMH